MSGNCVSGEGSALGSAAVLQDRAFWCSLSLARALPPSLPVPISSILPCRRLALSGAGYACSLCREAKVVTLGANKLSFQYRPRFIHR